MPPKVHEDLNLSDDGIGLFTLGYHSELGRVACGVTQSDYVSSREISPDNYQLGWHSAAFGRMSGGRIREMTVMDCNTGEELTLPQGRYAQIVTRGMMSCTGVVITKGPLFCFLHLDRQNVDFRRPNPVDDESKLPQHEQEVRAPEHRRADRVEQTLARVERYFTDQMNQNPDRPEITQAPATLMVSRISPSPEERVDHFPEYLFHERLKEVTARIHAYEPPRLDGGPPARERLAERALERPEHPTFQFIDRGSTSEFIHVELGVSAETSRRGDMLIFGDKTLRQADETCTHSLFSFGTQAPQLHVDSMMRFTQRPYAPQGLSLDQPMQPQVKGRSKGCC